MLFRNFSRERSFSSISAGFSASVWIEEKLSYFLAPSRFCRSWIYKKILPLALRYSYTYTRGISRVTRNRWEVWLLNYGSSANFTSLWLQPIARYLWWREGKCDFLSRLPSYVCLATTRIGQLKARWSYSLQLPILHLLSRELCGTWCETDKGHTRPELMIMSIISL